MFLPLGIINAVHYAFRHEVIHIRSQLCQKHIDFLGVFRIILALRKEFLYGAVHVRLLSFHILDFTIRSNREFGIIFFRPQEYTLDTHG